MGKLTYKDLVTSNRKDLILLYNIYKRNISAYKILSEGALNIIMNDILNDKNYEFKYLYENNIILDEGFLDWTKKHIKIISWIKKNKKKAMFIAFAILMNHLAGKGVFNIKMPDNINITSEDSINLTKELQKPQFQKVTIETINSLTPEQVNELSDKGQKLLFKFQKKNLIDANNNFNFNVHRSIIGKLIDNTLGVEFTSALGHLGNIPVEKLMKATEGLSPQISKTLFKLFHVDINLTQSQMTDEYQMSLFAAVTNRLELQLGRKFKNEEEIFQYYKKYSGKEIRVSYGDYASKDSSEWHNFDHPRSDPSYQLQNTIGKFVVIINSDLKNYKTYEDFIKANPSGLMFVIPDTYNVNSSKVEDERKNKTITAKIRNWVGHRDDSLYNKGADSTNREIDSTNQHNINRSGRSYIGAKMQNFSKYAEIYLGSGFYNPYNKENLKIKTIPDNLPQNSLDKGYLKNVSGNTDDNSLNNKEIENYSSKEDSSKTKDPYNPTHKPTSHNTIKYADYNKGGNQDQLKPLDKSKGETNGHNGLGIALGAAGLGASGVLGAKMHKKKQQNNPNNTEPPSPDNNKDNNQKYNFNKSSINNYFKNLNEDKYYNLLEQYYEKNNL